MITKGIQSKHNPSTGIVKNSKLNLETNVQQYKELSFRFKVHICKQYIESGQGFVLKINILDILVLLTLQVE